MIARGKICCTLHKTQVKLCKDVVSAAQEDSSPNLWHRRLAHMIIKYMNENPADMLTKVVSREKLKLWVELAGMNSD